jgi:hypothetical protein
VALLKYLAGFDMLLAQLLNQRCARPCVMAQGDKWRLPHRSAPAGRSGSHERSLAAGVLRMGNDAKGDSLLKSNS